jgi:hypothetical protein
MKNKDIYASSLLPVYEVTEMTMEEALFAISGKGDDRTESGILSGEVLHQYHQRHSTRQRPH